MNEFNNLSYMVLGNYRVKLSPGKTRLQYLLLELFTSSEYFSPCSALILLRDMYMHTVLLRCQWIRN